MKKRYRVKHFNDFTEPYWMANETKPIIRHIGYDEYVAYDEPTFMQIVADFVDAPKKKLNDAKIREDFDDARHRLSDNRVEVIKTYYNGRFDLMKKIKSDLKKANPKMNFPVVLKYTIPREMNYFSCQDNDPNDALTKLNDAFIEIEISLEA